MGTYFSFISENPRDTWVVMTYNNINVLSIHNINVYSAELQLDVAKIAFFMFYQQKKVKGWRNGSGSTEPAWTVRNPEFKPKCHQKVK
jgi:hypothetical protein